MNVIVQSGRPIVLPYRAGSRMFSPAHPLRWQSSSTQPLSSCTFACVLLRVSFSSSRPHLAVPVPVPVIRARTRPAFPSPSFLSLRLKSIGGKKQLSPCSICAAGDGEEEMLMTGQLQVQKMKTKTTTSTARRRRKKRKLKENIVVKNTYLHHYCSCLQMWRWIRSGSCR